MIELRRESADSEPARALFAEYMDLLRERLGQRFEPPPHILASASDFSVFLVLYYGEDPVACGGLRPSEPGTCEIARMFVAARARRRGHARRLLGELEAIARAQGDRRILLFTTGVLEEALALYATAGYERLAGSDGERADFWLGKRLAG